MIITQLLLPPPLPIKFPLEHCSDFVCNAAASMRIGAGVRAWDIDALIALALCLLVFHSLRTPDTIVRFIKLVQKQFNRGSPLLLAAHILKTLQKFKFRRSCYWTGMVALASFEPEHIRRRAEDSLFYVTAKVMADFAMKAATPSELLTAIRKLPHIDRYGFDIYRQWCLVVQLVCKLPLKRGSLTSPEVTEAASAMTKHVGVIMDCAVTAAKTNPINASVLACEVYALLSSLNLVPSMQEADLNRADYNGLMKLSDMLNKTPLVPVQDHPEQNAVCQHFASEIRRLKLPHTSVPLKTYARQCRSAMSK